MVGRNDKKQVEEVRRLISKKYYFSNVTQCDGLTVPTLEKSVGVETHDAAETQWGRYADGPAVEHGGESAFYAHAIDRIQMPERRRFASTEAYYQALFHEGIHSTGAKKRLNRSTLTQAGRFGDANYSQEELVAEMGGAMLLAHAGLEPTYANSAAYLRGWLKSLNDDKRLVVVAAQSAAKATRYALGKRPPEASGARSAALHAGSTSEA